MELNANFAYVVATGVSSVLLHHIWMGGRVIAARKKYKVKYPALYASPENCPDEKTRHAFNCVQRSHQNSLELQPAYLFLLLTAGLKYPVTAAGFGAVWLLGRVFYFLGYSSGEPEKRLRGAFGFIGLFGLIGTCVKTAYDLLTSA